MELHHYKCGLFYIEMFWSTYMYLNAIISQILSVSVILFFFLRCACKSSIPYTCSAWARWALLKVSFIP